MRLILAFLFALPALAATGNGVTLMNFSGSAQTSRPVTVSRVFSRSEIAHCPKAVISGSPVTTQADVRTRWLDGSVRHVMVSFLATIAGNGSTDVTFIDQACPSNTGYLDKAAMLGFMGGNWGADTELTKTAVTVTADVRTMLTAWDGTDTGINGSGVRYWLKGPVVTQVIVEDRTSARAYDLGWDANKALHPFFILTFYPGYTSGVKVDYVVENMWAGNTAGQGLAMSDQSYSVVLNAGSPLAQVYSHSTFTHWGRTRWRQTFWSGSALPYLKVDLNFHYMMQTGAVLTYQTPDADPTSGFALDAANYTSTGTVPDYSNGGAIQINGIYKAYLAKPYDIGGISEWEPQMDTTGGRPDLGVEPLWYVAYLFSLPSTDPNSANMDTVLRGMADASGSWVIHYRENLPTANLSGSYYCNSTTLCATGGLSNTVAFGRPLSVDARLTMRTDFPYADSSGNSGDNLPVTSLGTPIPTGTAQAETFADGAMAHQPDMAYVPYLVTGDYYYLEELQMWSAFDVAWLSVDPNSYWQRAGTWGNFWNGQPVPRSVAWGMRTVGETAVMSPDGTPEAAYFREKMDTNLATMEGWMNITTGHFYDVSPGSKWTYGATVLRTSPNGGAPGNVLHVTFNDQFGTTSPVPTDSGNIWMTAPWMANYFRESALHLYELGFQIDAILDWSLVNLIHGLKDPSYNPYTQAEGYWLPNRNADGTHFTTWVQSYNALSAAWKANNTLTTINQVNHGYAWITRGAAAVAKIRHISDTTSTVSDGVNTCANCTGSLAFAWIDGLLPKVGQNTHFASYDLRTSAPQWQLASTSLWQDPSLPVTITTASTGSGSGSVSGGGNYTIGAMVNLFASPTPGSAVTGWSGGGCGGTSTSCSFTAANDTTVTVTFSTIQQGHFGGLTFGNIVIGK